MKKLFFIAVAILALGIFSTQATYALKIDPTLLSATLNPGESKVLRVTLTNDANAPVELQPKMYSAEAGSKETGFPVYAPVQADDTLANWVKFSTAEPIALKENESKKVDFTLSLPADAAPGGHYAAIGWGILSKPTEGGNVSILGQIMTNIALDVPGVVFEKGEIASFSTKNDITKYDHLPIDFSIRVTNAGNRHFKPVGNVMIKDMFGRTAVLLPVNDGIGGGNVLPQSTREFKVTWKEGLALGKYTATANLLLGGSGNVTATYSFWVLPILLLSIWTITALIIIAILVLIVLKIVRSKKKTAI